MLDIWWSVAAAAALVVLVVFALADADIVLLFCEKFGKNADSLSGKVIWITGASSGIGEHMAYCLAKAGCRLVLSARRREELERVKKECLKQGKGLSCQDENILVLPLDVIDFERHQGAVDEVLEHFKQIDILVNNAGRSQMAKWQEVELPVDRNLFEINVLGPVSLTQKVLPHMIQRGGGHVAVVSSLAGKIGLPGARSYAGSKHAVHGYFEALRTELASSNIEVTMICPGPVHSKLYLEAATDKIGQSLGREMERFEKRMSTSRCAHLSCVSLANQLSETWITQQPILLSIYLMQYAPNVGRWVLKQFGAKQVMKFREGKA